MVESSHLRQLAATLDDTVRVLREMAALLDSMAPLSSDPDLDADLRGSSEMSVRTKRACRRQGITTLRQLSGVRRGDVEQWRGVGTVSLQEIQQALERHGLSFRS